MVTGRARRVSRWRAAGLSLVALLIGWLGTAYAIFQHPSVDNPSKADAIVVLGEPDEPALDKALSLIDQGLSANLVLLIPYGPPPQCSSPPHGVSVFCVVPDPLTTRGDAQSIGALAAKHDWDHLVVVTWTSHISRSRMLIERCFDGIVQMVDYRQNLSASQWLKEYIYQSGAYIKAFVTPAC